MEICSASTSGLLTRRSPAKERHNQGAGMLPSEAWTMPQLSSKSIFHAGWHRETAGYHDACQIRSFPACGFVTLNGAQVAPVCLLQQHVKPGIIMKPVQGFPRNLGVLAVVSCSDLLAFCKDRPKAVVRRFFSGMLGFMWSLRASGKGKRGLASRHQCTFDIW